MAISRSSGGISSLIKEVQYQDAVSRTGGKVTQQVQEIESESEDIVIPPPTLPLPQTTSDDASKMQKDAVLTSCYGAKGSTNDCNTCDDVINAYKANDWSYDTNLFAQCKKEGRSKTTSDDASKMQKDAVLTSCYGAKGSTNDCNTCDDVINAYKANDWSYDTNLFAQCKKEGKSKTTSDDASKMQKDAVLSPSPQASSADSTLYDNKQWESELNPLVVRKNNTESNWVRDVIGYFIVINWLLGAIAFVFTFNWNDTSNRNDMKRSVIIFFFGFWGFLMFEF